MQRLEFCLLMLMQAQVFLFFVFSKKQTPKWNNASSRDWAGWLSRMHGGELDYGPATFIKAEGAGQFTRKHPHHDHDAECAISACPRAHTTRAWTCLRIPAGAFCCVIFNLPFAICHLSLARWPENEACEMLWYLIPLACIYQLLSLLLDITRRILIKTVFRLRRM